MPAFRLFLLWHIGRSDANACQNVVHSSSVPVGLASATTGATGAAALAPCPGKRATFVARFGPRRSTGALALAEVCLAGATGGDTALADAALAGAALAGAAAARVAAGGAAVALCMSPAASLNTATDCTSCCA